MKLVSVLVLFSVLACCHSMPPNMEKMMEKMQFFNSDGSWKNDLIKNFIEKFKQIEKIIKGFGIGQNKCEGLSWGDKKSWGGNKGKSWLDEFNYEYEEPERVKTKDQPQSSIYDVYTMKAAKWVCSEMKSDNRKCATSKMFKKLFDYINSNDIKMTIPVATKVEGDKFTECFYLPTSHQENTPEPDTGSGVFIKEKPDLKLLSLKFKDWGYEDKVWTEQLEKLKSYVGGNYKYDDSFYITAVYTDPSKAFKKQQGEIELHSEVWLVVQ